jgi:hypothetical protein
VIILASACAIAGLTTGRAQTPAGAQTASERAPVRRVVLFKSGVGYFEHLGRVRDDQTVTIAFTSGQLNDVLKSLTALDLGGGAVSRVSFNTQDGLDRRIGELRLPIGTQPTRGQFLSALRGARLQVRSGARRLEGRLLGVEQMPRSGTDGRVEALTLITDDGRMETVLLEAGVGVQILESELTEEVSRYLTLVASARDQDVRRLAIATTGTGERDLFVSYISEVPVWKATYRLVLPEAGSPRRPMLQGWAIVDNTVGEDWVDVRLSLVAGAPQSFIQQISQPYYVQRPSVALPRGVQLTPQTHQSAVSVSETVAAGQITSAQPTTRGAGRTGVAGGVAGGVPNVTMDGVSSVDVNPLASPVFREGVAEAIRQQTTQATAADLGDLFEYAVTEPITLPRNQSALVPILGGEVEARKVSIWNPARGLRNPLRAVWLTNSTSLTLDAGTFSVIEGDAFAGEGLMEPLKAGERRLLSYATDLGVVVARSTEPFPARVRRVEIDAGVIVQHVEERQTFTYLARNQDDEVREIVIEHAVREGWTSTGQAEPAESTEQWHRFVVSVEAGGSASLAVADARNVETRYRVDTVGEQMITLWSIGGTITPEIEAGLREVIARRTAVGRLDADLAARRTEIDSIGQDQARVRENMQALRGSSEEKRLLQRYVAQLDAQETRLAALRGEIETLTAERERRQADLEAFIRALKAG